MKSKIVFHSLMGSALVYIAMAACVTAENIPNGSTATTGAVGPSDSEGSGFADAMVDPVPDANAGDICKCQEIPKSGTRLKPITWNGADGSIGATISFHDTERNEVCVPQNASDGTWRCMPLGVNGAPSDYVQFSSTFIP